jgi:hypothetical protein
MTDKSSKRKSPLVEEAYYSEAIAILKSPPKATHPVWAKLKSSLENTTASQRSKSTLYKNLEAACAEEKSAWAAFDFITRGCQDGLKMINPEAAGIHLYRLMGVVSKGSRILFQHYYLYGQALEINEKLADLIFLFLGLLHLNQKFSSDLEVSRVCPILQSKCREMERLLMRNRGAPKIRHFMELLIEETDDSSSEGSEEVDQEEDQPSQKRRCIENEDSE